MDDERGDPVQQIEIGSMEVYMSTSDKAFACCRQSRSYSIYSALERAQ